MASRRKKKGNASKEKRIEAKTHVKMQHRHIDVVQQLPVVIHTLATRKEDDDLLAHVLLEEGEEEEEPTIRLADDVALLEGGDGGGGSGRVDVDVEGSRSEGDSSEIGDLGGLGGGEEHGLTVVWRRGGREEGRVRLKKICDEG